jgi:serine/threonine protein kinase
LGRLARYRILEVLGVGGMGMVFRAVNIDLDRAVAVKVVRPDHAEDTKTMQRFLREAKALASVRDDHVVNVHRVGQDRGVVFLEMELLEGESLEQRLRREGKLPLADVLRIGRQVALGLAAAHEKGLIHRDIKPANIWLEPLRNPDPGGPQFRVKLLDFGIARKTEEDHQITQNGMFMGTAGYISPEQARAQTLDARSDLFALGCVLFRLCAGRLPFTGDTLTAQLTSLAVDDASPLDQVAPGVPRGLAELVRDLLNKKPARRPESAAVVAERLRELEGKRAPTEQIAARSGAKSKADGTDLPWWHSRRIWLWSAISGAGLILGGLLVWWLVHSKQVQGPPERDLRPPVGPLLPPRDRPRRPPDLRSQALPTRSVACHDPLPTVTASEEAQG